MKFLLTLFKVLLLFTVFCIPFYLNAGKKADSESNKFVIEKSGRIQSDQDKTVLIRIFVTKKNNVVKVDIKEKKIIEGYYKEIDLEYLSRNEGDLVYQIFNEEQFVIKELAVKNPLKTRLEFPNYDNSIGSKEVDLIEKEVIIRFNYLPEMKSLIINIINRKGTLDKLKTVPLNNE